MWTLLWFLACDAISVEKVHHDSDTALDADGDGVIAGEDCDDTDSSVYPGADEFPDDQKDSNCDGKDNT